MALTAMDGYEAKQSTIPPGRKPLRAGGINQQSTINNQQSPKVLVMDDEEMLRNLADQMLNRLGYDIETAKNGSEAIELYKQAMNAGKPFDAVILDLTIKGGMGGKGAVKALLKIDPQVKAIVASGYSNDPVITDFKQYGFMDALVKPHTMEDLGNALDKIMGGS
jgi:CheY-like chemotaxis protein